MPRVTSLRAFLTLLVASTSAAGDCQPDLGHALPPPEAQAQCLLERRLATEAADEGSWSTAAEHFRKATDAFPGSYSDWYGLGAALARSGQAADALAALERAASLGVGFASAWVADPDLASLGELAEFQQLGLSLPRRRELAKPRYGHECLAKTRDEIEQLTRRLEDDLERSADLLGPPQSAAARNNLARWRAASLGAIAATTTSPSERCALNWEALLGFLTDTFDPASDHAASDVLDHVSTHDSTNCGHDFDVGYAVATARWLQAVVDSPRPSARLDAAPAYRSDLLALAAVTADDQPGLDRALLRLSALVTLRDRWVALGLYRRLLRIAGDSKAARQAVGVSAPGLVLLAEGTPTFEAKTIEGRPLSTTSLLGHVTVLDFWATWCKPCVAQLPDLRRLHDDHAGRGLRLIGLAVEDEETTTANALAAWCRDQRVTWPQVFDVGPRGSTVAASLGIGRVPYLLLFDQRGQLVAAATEVPSLLADIERLLATPN
jgi:thiol-disulfide isomerase/thioredoxin